MTNTSSHPGNPQGKSLSNQLNRFSMQMGNKDRKSTGDFLFKVILLGNSKVGKSSIVMRLVVSPNTDLSYTAIGWEIQLGALAHNGFWLCKGESLHWTFATIELQKTCSRFLSSSDTLSVWHSRFGSIRFSDQQLFQVSVLLNSWPRLYHLLFRMRGEVLKGSWLSATRAVRRPLNQWTAGYFRYNPKLTSRTQQWWC